MKGRKGAGLCEAMDEMAERMGVAARGWMGRLGSGVSW